MTLSRNNVRIREGDKIRLMKDVLQEHNQWNDQPTSKGWWWFRNSQGLHIALVNEREYLFGRGTWFDVQMLWSHGTMSHEEARRFQGRWQKLQEPQ